LETTKAVLGLAAEETACWYARNAVDGCRSDEWCNGDFRIFKVLATVPLAQLVDDDVLQDLNADLVQQLSGRLRTSWLQTITNFASLTQRISIYHRRIQGGSRGWRTPLDLKYQTHWLQTSTI